MGVRHLSEKYTVTIKSTSPDFEISGILPASVSLGVSSDWANALPGINLGGAETAIQTVTNRTTVVRELTAPIWKGTSHVSLNFSMEMHAEESARKEIINPLHKLYQLVLPTGKDQLFLTPPGPRLVGNPNNTRLLTGGTIITIYISDFLRFEKVLINNLSTNFHTATVDEFGQPMAATVNVGFRSYLIPTADEMADILHSGARGATALRAEKGGRSDYSGRYGPDIDRVPEFIQDFGDEAENYFNELADSIIPF